MNLTADGNVCNEETEDYDLSVETIIFVNITSSLSLTVLLSSMTEHDLIKYDSDSRHQIITELQALCLRFNVKLPLYLIGAAEKQDIYNKQAKLRGITPRSVLDYVNDDFDSDFESLEDFRRWLAAQTVAAPFVNTQAIDEE